MARNETARIRNVARRLARVLRATQDFAGWATIGDVLAHSSLIDVKRVAKRSERRTSPTFARRRDAEMSHRAIALCAATGTRFSKAHNKRLVSKKKHKYRTFGISACAAHDAHKDYANKT